MTQQIINIGTAPNDGQGDPIRTAFAKTNNNFSQLYSIPQSSPPPTLVGRVGDFAGMYAYDSTYFYYCFANYTGNSTIWAQITQAGNISVSAINNGNSNVSIGGVGANVTVAVHGTSNVAVFTNYGILTSGLISAQGNVRGGNINTVGLISATGNITGNYFIGNGSQLTGLPATYSDANVAAYLPTYTGNLTAGNISVTGSSQAASYSAAGNITGNNISSASIVSATGNIYTSGYFVGDFAGNISGNLVVPGSNTQVLFNTNGNSDAVAGMTYNKDSNIFTVLGTISSQGNTIGGNIVTAGLITAAGNVYAGNIINSGVSSVTGNITGGNLLTGGLVSAAGSLNAGTTVIAAGNIRGGNLISNGIITATGNVTGGNILTTGAVSATGNITGAYFSAGNSINSGGNISAVNYSGTSISVTGNVTGGNILTNGLISSAGNATHGNILTGGNVIATGNISATGNITGNYFIGNGSQLTGIITSISANALTGNTLASGVLYSSLTQVGTLSNLSVTGDILTNGISSAVGNVTGGNILTSGQISSTGNIAGGNLSVADGTVTVGNIVASGNIIGNIGSATNTFNTVFAQATTALYADLAECYLADADYPPGTVVSFGGTAEVTVSQQDADPLIAGVVSTRPAHLMNSGLSGDHVAAVALVGRVPCRVLGPVTAGAMMVSAGYGMARAEANPAIGTVIGKAVESFTGDSGTIEIVVGRL